MIQVERNPDQLVCLQLGRWHRTWCTIADCERYNRYTMQARDVRTDHAAQLRDTERGVHIIAVADNLAELVLELEWK